MSSPGLASPVRSDKNHLESMDLYQAEVTLLPGVVVSPDTLPTLDSHGRRGKLPWIAIGVHRVVFVLL